MKGFATFLALGVLARAAHAQAGIATDLWRVAQGTLTRPAAIAEGSSAPLWSPAIALDSSTRLRVGVEAVHAPSETGVQSGFLGLSLRAGPATINAGYGRIGISDVAFTETSPEAIGGSIPIWSQSLSAGVGLAPLPSVVAGAAVRMMSGRLGPSARSHVTMDVGARYTGFRRVTLGAATQFLGPGSAARGAVYSLGGEYRTAPRLMANTPASVALRYGATLQAGESAQHLLIGSIGYGRLALDWGAAREHAFEESLWRSRFGVSIAAGGYQVEIGRDGGVNGFGATWRFGLTGDFR